MSFNNELLLSSEIGSRKQHEFSKGQDTIAFNDFGETLGLLNLLGNGFWSV